MISWTKINNPTPSWGKTPSLSSGFQDTTQGSSGPWGNTYLGNASGFFLFPFFQFPLFFFPGDEWIKTSSTTDIWTKTLS